MAESRPDKIARQLAEQQKENIRLQTEYNEALKLSSSMSKNLTDGIDDTIKGHSRLSEKAKDYLTNLKSSVSELESSEEISKKLVDIDKEKEKLSSNFYNLSDRANAILLEQLQRTRDGLNIEQGRLHTIEKVNEAATKLSETMGGIFDGLVEDVKEIPVIGKLLGGLGDIGTKLLKEKLSNAAKNFTTQFASGLREGKTVMQSLSGASAGLAESLAILANPYVLIGAAIVATAAAGVIAFYKVSSAAKAFREETGLLNSQTAGLDKQMVSVLGKTSALGASLDDISEAASTFTGEFNNIEMASDEVLTSMVTLNKNFGVGVEEGAKLNKIFQNIGGLSAEQSQYLISQTVSMARLAKVAPSQVIKDMADNSEYAYRYFQGSPEQLAKAAVQAAKLGTSIGEAGKVADNLLDFQNSITSELEASAILGTNINLGQARYLAANGKILESQQAVVDQVASLGDLTKLNKFEQDALTNATGMSLESLINQQRIRERFGKLGEEELATAMQVLKTGGDINKMNKADLAAKTKELALQQEMQSDFDTAGNQLAAIGNELLMAFMPVGITIMKALGPIMQIVGGLISGFLKPFMAIINSIFDHLSKAFAPLSKMMGSSNGLFKIFEKIGEVVGFITSLFYTGIVVAIETSIAVLSGFVDIFGGLIKLFKGDFIGGLSQIGDGIVSLMFKPWIAGFNAVMDYLEGFFTIFSDLGVWMHKYLIDPINNFVGGIGSVIQSIGSVLGGGAPESAGQTPPTDSVNDGVIQNGKVITTNPSDTLIATKNPSALANSVATDGGLGGLLNTISNAAGSAMGTINGSNRIIEKLDELIAVTAGGKNIYMDREKVSSAVVNSSEKSSQNRFGLMGA
jgi:hypothetical protein